MNSNGSTGNRLLLRFLSFHCGVIDDLLTSFWAVVQVEAAFVKAKLVTWTEAKRAPATENYLPLVGRVLSSYGKKARMEVTHEFSFSREHSPRWRLLSQKQN